MNRDHDSGKHDFPKTLKNCGIDPRLLYDDVHGIDDWVDRVIEFAESGITERYTSNDLKGDAFEHLVQCIIQYLGNEKAINCIDLNATKQNKVGIDLIGTTLDGRPHLHQCKFTKNSKLRMPYRGAVAEFVGACQSYDQGSGYEMTLWTTGDGIRKIAQDTVGPALRVFGIDWLGDNLGSDESFWDNVYARSLYAVPTPKIGRISKKHKNPITPHDYQQEALNNFIRKRKEKRAFKGRYIYPTGAGKTLIESLILNQQIDLCDGGSHLVVAPRIALLIQLMREYRELIGDRYIPIGLHSGSEEPEVDDSDWMRRTQKNTTDQNIVKREIHNAQSMNKSVVVFSTYHSLHKLTPKFDDFSFDTMIADESQYCVSENYFDQVRDIDAKIKLFFTATERHYVKKDGTKVERSNDNETVFGKSLGSQTVRNLVKRGILVEPILHLMRGATRSGEVNHDTLVAEARHIANEQRCLVSKNLHAKTLFACREAANVEIIVDLKNNKENLKRLQRNVPDHTIFTIISKKPFGAMIDGEEVNRKTFLDRLKSCNGNALIFHYNILSEGIDVDGITGVAILRKMGDAKMMQTIGRCLRPYKKDPSLKPYAYVSVPIIEDDLRKSDHLNEIVRKILESGLEIDAEKVVISDIGKEDNIVEDRIVHSLGNREKTQSSTQIELDIFKHELKKIIKVTEEKISENYHMGMLHSKFTNDVVNDILDGKYLSEKFHTTPRSITQGLAGSLDSYVDRYFVIDKAWCGKRMLESQDVRPITPVHMIQRHVSWLGDVTDKLTLTFNIEYVPYLKEKGARVVLATKEFCEATKNLAESQVIETEYLTLEAVMEKGIKFDFVIGNPPYQEAANIGNPIWQDFVQLGLDVLKAGGKMGMIHPPEWRGIGRTKARSMEKIRQSLKDTDIEWISMTSKQDCGKVFVGKATPFDVYVTRKSNTSNFVTKIEGTDGSVTDVCIKGMDFIPSFNFEEVNSLVAKSEEERVEFVYESSPYHTSKSWMSDKETKKFCYPCVYSISAEESLRDKDGGKLTCHYSSTKTPPVKKKYDKHFGVPKVIFGKSHESGIPFVDHKGEYGMTEFIAAIVAPPPHLELIAKAMDGSRFRKIMDAVRFNTEDWNKNVIPLFRKDFWKDFVNGNGDLVDDQGNVIDRNGNLVDENGKVILSDEDDITEAV